VLAGGCFNDGEEGQPCAVTRDCVKGLVCDNPTGMAGTCRKPGDVPFRPDAAAPDGPQRDTSTAPDVAADRPADAPPADAPPADGPTRDGPDGGSGDGSAGDGGGSDVSTGDALRDGSAG
jgi:hypothetical protein